MLIPRFGRQFLGGFAFAAQLFRGDYTMPGATLEHTVQIHMSVACEGDTDYQDGIIAGILSAYGY